MKNNLRNLIKCPYCGYGEVADLKDSAKVYCKKCEKPFRINVTNVKRYNIEPLDVVMEHKGYIISQTGSKKFALTKVIDEFDSKSEAMDALLDMMMAYQKDGVKKPNKKKTQKDNNGDMVKTLNDLF